MQTQLIPTRTTTGTTRLYSITMTDDMDQEHTWWGDILATASECLALILNTVHGPDYIPGSIHMTATSEQTTITAEYEQETYGGWICTERHTFHLEATDQSE